MILFDFLSLLNTDIVPSETKIHLATWNGEDDPLDVYLAGGFNEWQRWQTRKNFERKYIVSLISLPGTDKWLFGGLHLSTTAIWKEKHNCYFYKLVEDKGCVEMNGRIIASFTRSGRQPYLNAEKWVDDLLLSEVMAERLEIGDFPGFKSINLTKRELEVVVRQSSDSWRTTLSNVAGVYLISDTVSGQLYIGSASGEGGIWQRWSEYAVNGHGGNTKLRQLLKVEGKERAKHFRYSVLEIADTHASREDLLSRESHWKDILLSRSHGLNAN